MQPGELKRWVGRAVVLGLAIRLVHLLAILGTTIPRWQDYTAQGDFSITWKWAAQIRAGDWLGRPPYHPETEWMKRLGSPADWARWWGGIETYHQAPLYPYLIAAVADPPRGSPAVVFVLQTLLGLACVPMVAWLAWRWAGPLAGICAAFLWALTRTEVALESFMVRDAIAMPLLLAGLCLLERLRTPPGRSLAALGAGLFFGLATLDRENIALLALGAVPLAAWLWLRDCPAPPPMAHRARTAAIVVAGLALALTPLVVRNLLVGAPATALSNRGPEVILQGLGVAPGADPIGINVFPALGGQLEEARGSALRSVGIVLREGLGQPLRFARMLIRKGWAWLSAGEPPDNVELDYLVLRSPVLRLCIPTWLLLGPALLGVALSLGQERRRRLSGLWTFGLLTFPLMASIVLWRIRAGALPVLVPFAAIGLSWMRTQLRESRRRFPRERRAFFAAALALVAFTTLSRFGSPVPVFLLRPTTTSQSVIIRLDEGDAGAALYEIEEYLAFVQKGQAEASPPLVEMRERISAASAGFRARAEPGAE